MEDFFSYSQRKEEDVNELNGDLASLISSLAAKYDGASEGELLSAIYKEAEKGRRNGTLSDKDLDNFARILSPLLDEGKRAKLKKVIEKLKTK